jgi:hypothetical protein
MASAVAEVQKDGSTGIELRKADSPRLVLALKPELENNIL